MNEGKTPTAESQEPEEVFQDAWGIDDALDLDSQLPPTKEIEKELGPKSSSSSTEIINPFKVIPQTRSTEF